MKINPLKFIFRKFFTKKSDSFIEQSPILSYDIPRSNMLHTFSRMIMDSRIQGDFVELGVFRGDTARILNFYAKGRKLFLFDTFKGFHPSDLKKDDIKLLDDFSNTSVDHVLKVVENIVEGGEIVIKEGIFPDTVNGLGDHVFALVHLDCDLSEPMKHALNFFYPQLISGGIIIIHDYISDKYPNIRNIVDHFFWDKPEKIFTIMGVKTGSAIVIKK